MRLKETALRLQERFQGHLPSPRDQNGSSVRREEATGRWRGARGWESREEQVVRGKGEAGRGPHLGPRYSEAEAGEKKRGRGSKE